MPLQGENRAGFSEDYGQIRRLRFCTREDASPLDEQGLQCVWYDQLYPEQDLRTDEGHALRIVSPGWWNRQEGPDFKGAQIEFNGKLFTGDVEVHLASSGWTAHGHHRDARYDQVILHVVYGGEPGQAPATTAGGRRVPTLRLERLLRGGPQSLAGLMIVEDPGYAVQPIPGKCSEWTARGGREALAAFVRLAGEWRMLNKARALRERMDCAGVNQAVYEALMYACGFSHFKHHFRTVARHLPYDRARQLAQQDPLRLECALLQIAGLLPDKLPPGTAEVPHFARLCAVRRDCLEGLRSLPLEWRRNGVRPNNNPERRLAGAAMFLARSASKGLVETLDSLWREEASPLARRRQFEGLFPRAGGFWAAHCTWTGKTMDSPIAPLGPGRVRSIIGNVFLPAALALARRERDRVKEEKVFAFFCALPAEPDNRIVKAMLPRIFGAAPPARIDFRTQQGLMQIHEDWCEANPSCRNCTALHYLESIRFSLNSAPEHA